MQSSDYAKWFRGSTPYISAHRDKTFVVFLPHAAIEGTNLTNIVHDLALLHVLGVRLVLVHGATTETQDVGAWHQRPEFSEVIDAARVEELIGEAGRIRAKLEALFSTGLPNTPLHNVDVTVTSGNFVTAKPVGVIDGVDQLFAGQVRRVETERVAKILDTQSVVLVSPVGYSPSGQAFCLNPHELAAGVASSLGADKLIAFDEAPHVERDGQRISTVTPAEIDASTSRSANLAALAQAVRSGVGKGHLVSFLADGALLEELFTAAGIGTQVLPERHEPVRDATIDDVSGIVEVIRPLEESGALVRRSRGRLEQEIGAFLVAELDDIVVGCCAVFAYGAKAELACIAVHENYRIRDGGTSIGARLLAAAEAKAASMGCERLFALTTQTRDWFLDQGFDDAGIDVLPDEKQSLYNWQRNSKVLIKALTRN